MKKKMNATQLIKQGRMLNRHFRFWCALARITRFSLHGFVLWRCRAVAEAGEIYNRRAAQLNRETRRVVAAGLSGKRRSA